MDRDTFLWTVYVEVAKAFNTARLPHTVLHGVDYDKHIVGRDCDMLVRKKDLEKAISLTKTAFCQSIGGGISVVKWPWGCWCLMTSIIDGKRFCAEIDIAWCYPYRTVILTDDSLLDFNDKEIEYFYLDGWNQFAKCFILRFLASNFDSFNSRRIQEIEIYANQLINSGKIPDILKPESLLWIKQCCHFDINKLKVLRANFKLWKFSLKYPIESIRNLGKVLIFFLSRKMRMYKVLGDLKVVASDESVKTLIEREFDGSFITKFKWVKCNSLLQYYILYIIAFFTTPPFQLTVYFSNRKLTSNFCEIRNESEAKSLVDDFYNAIILKYEK